MHDLNYCMPDLNYCMPDLNYCGITAELLSNRLNYCMPEKIHRETSSTHSLCCVVAISIYQRQLGLLKLN